MDVFSGTVVLELSGEYDISTAAALADRLGAALLATPRALLLDLSRVTFLDCAALGVMLRARALARRIGAEFTLYGVRASPRRLFETLERAGTIDGSWWHPLRSHPLLAG